MDADVPNRNCAPRYVANGNKGVDLFTWLGRRSTEHPHVRTLAEAWLTWRQRTRDRRGTSEVLPSLCDLDPLDMVPALPWVWLWALDKDGQLRLRLVGEEAKRAIGNWERGSLLEEVVPLEIRPKVAERYGRVLGDPAILGVDGDIVFRSGASVPGFRLILPLTSGKGDDERPVANADGLIGITSYAGDLSALRNTGGLQGDAQGERFLPAADVS